MQKTKIVVSFNYAIEGFIYVLKSQRNMRIHFLFSVLILLLGIYLNVAKVELIMLFIAVAFVLFAEMFNTAIEYTVDLVTKTANPLARVIKDIAAGAVLLSAINGFIVVYIVFSKHLNLPFENMVLKIKQSPWHITFIALIIVLSTVVLGKMFLRSGTPLRGGMPSGHSALAFSIWTAIVFSTPNNFIVALTFILAFLVARSRLIRSIHNVWEVLAGSVLGILITTLVFQLLR